MAKRTSKRKNVIKYLLFTVVALLVTVSLLSLFVYKFANFASNNVVLGASTSPVLSTLLCGSCSGSIVLQKEGTNPKNWGASCVPAGAEKTIKNIGFVSCVVNRKLMVYITDNSGKPMIVPAKVMVYSGGSKPEKFITSIYNVSQWSMNLPSDTGYWLVVPSQGYSVTFIGGDVPPAGLDSKVYRYIHPLNSDVTGVTVEFKKVVTPTPSVTQPVTACGAPNYKCPSGFTCTYCTGARVGGQPRPKPNTGCICIHNRVPTSTPSVLK